MYIKQYLLSLIYKFTIIIIIITYVMIVVIIITALLLLLLQILSILFSKLKHDDGINSRYDYVTLRYCFLFVLCVSKLVCIISGRYNNE